jgi:hypothetical protein
MCAGIRRSSRSSTNSGVPSASRIRPSAVWRAGALAAVALCAMAHVGCASDETRAKSRPTTGGGTVVTGAAPRPSPSGEAKVVETTMEAYLRLYARSPRDACRRYLTAQAIRQQDSLHEVPNCQTKSVSQPASPKHRLTITVASPKKARVYYQVLDPYPHPFCAARPGFVPQRTDTVRRTRLGWKISHFGFGRILCVPR